MTFWWLIIFFVLTVTPGWAEDLRDVKPPVDLPNEYFWLMVLAAIVIFSVAAFSCFRLFRYWRKPAAKAPPSPWETALARLEDLRRKNLPASGQVKEYYSQLSDIVRRYIEDRFEIHAPEMTTQEFLWSLKNSQDLSVDHKDLLTDFLNSCDLVKFAKYGPSPKEMEDSILSAGKFIQDTKPVAPAPASS